LALCSVISVINAFSSKSSESLTRAARSRKVRQRFAALGALRHGIDEFAQVVSASCVFAGIAIHQHVKIAAMQKNGLQKSAGADEATFSLQVLNQFPEILERRGGAS